MLGVGGVLAEALADVAFRLVPLDARRRRRDDRRPARRQALLGRVPGRAGGRPRRAGRRAARPLPARRGDDPDVVSVDVNPLIVVDGRPVAVDALVEVASA